MSEAEGARRMAIDVLHASVRRAVRIDLERAALTVLAATLLAASALFVVHRAVRPWDGSDVGGAGIPYSRSGVAVVPHPGTSASVFEAGDRVESIAGRSAEEWAGALADPGAMRPALGDGDALDVVVARDGGVVPLTVRLGDGDLVAPLAAQWGVLVFAFAMQLVGLYLFARRPREPAARALLVAGTGMFASSVPWALGMQVSDLLEGTGFWLYAISAGLSYSLFWSGALHFALVFPQPHPVAEDGTRRILLAYVIPLGAQLGLIVGAAVATGRALAALEAWMVGQLLVQPVVIVATLGLMGYGYWRLVDPVSRQQLRWVAAAVVLVAVGSFGLWFGPEVAIGEPLVPRSAVALLGIPFPIALGVAISRHHLFDLDVLVNRSVVYAGLTAGVVITYAATVAIVSGLVLGDAPFATALLGAGAAAVVALPLRDRLQQGVDRLMFGDRADPHRAVRRLGQRLEGSLDPRTVLPMLVETLAESLRVPYVALEFDRDGQTVPGASIGSRPTGGTGERDLLYLPITYRGRVVGRLTLSQREPGVPFSEADEELLTDLVRQAAPAVEAVRLTADLQRSRQQLVAAREEERRRLRRDLHDGLGPTLAASLMKLQAARAMADRQPTRSRELLDELEAETRRTIEDVRRIAYELRPPMLDELGLVAALRQQAGNFTATLDGTPLDVTVEAPSSLESLPAAVEVAGFRIALEALVNVIRHSGARHVRVRVRRDDDDLVIEVSDDGRGLARGTPPGVGLTSMRERAEELGGSLRLDRPRAGGTRVVARLPIGSGALA